MAARPGHRPRRHAMGIIGAVLVGTLLIAAILAPIIAPHDPSRQDLPARLQPPSWIEGGSPQFLLGTDQLGRDQLSRIVYGARVSIGVGVAATMLAGVIGVALGLVAGYYRGLADQVIMRLVDVLLAFPALLLAIALMATLRPGIGNVIAVLGFSGWVQQCRIVRGIVLGLRETEYVISAVAIGNQPWRVLLRHILPNVVPTITVLTTLQMAVFVLAESNLSFLGLGLPPTVPSWGSIMNEGREYFLLAWWIQTFPGLALFSLVLGIGLLGNWLRDVLDPRLRT